MVRASMASRWVVVNIDVGSVDGGKQRRVRKRCTLSFKCHVKVGRENFCCCAVWATSFL